MQRKYIGQKQIKRDWLKIYTLHMIIYKNFTKNIFLYKNKVFTINVQQLNSTHNLTYFGTR